MISKLCQSYDPWHLKFLTYFSLSSQLFFYPCMDLNELGRSVPLPVQVWMCMWGYNEYSTNFTGVMALDTEN